jgi:putative FmdB family regulatory protein
MPIFEFRCLSCNHVFELLSLCGDDTVEMKCPECQGTGLERVLSRVSYVMGSSSEGGAGKPQVTTKSCSCGTCSSIDIPGPSR